MIWRSFKAELYRFSRLTWPYVTFAIMLVFVLLDGFDVLGLSLGYIIKGHEAYQSWGYEATLAFIGTFIVVSIFCSEFSKKNYRNLVSRVEEKYQVFIGKYLAFVTIILVINIFFAFVTTIVYTISNGWGNISVGLGIYQIIRLVFKNTIYILTRLMFPMIFAFLFDSDALVVIIYAAYNMLETFTTYFASLYRRDYILEFLMKFSTINYPEFTLLETGLFDNWYMAFAYAFAIAMSILIPLFILRRKNI